ncbi:hypothetical protein GTA08_BOTSDO06836 [Botryosphaeria dothidea]|uniref:Uncharacterized protein n=1 Tax=Botryosphaeria dothidea TaxID=55169 RepID=A0A8H4II47_9PEZI|nr:hypothetical protein GTA08_BOTSDO11030 [Botryosphaeria dothidea]KAF4305529.1 hypothetical protein GTA08_BOTSDO06836 [Botryosphaeria dothidea]
MRFHAAVLIITTLAVVKPVQAGPVAYGICQAGCAAVVTACYAAAGFTWGATLGATAPASIIACNAGFDYKDTMTNIRSPERYRPTTENIEGG